MLTTLEKQSLLIHILEDLRGNWAYDVDRRCDEAYDLAQELGYEHIMASIVEFQAEVYRDGRWFRMDWEHGGYCDPPFETIRHHSSPEFTQAVEMSCTYPEDRLDPDNDDTK